MFHQDDKAKTINHHEISKITDILLHKKPGTCLVLDLDNTVMEAVSELGSDQWFIKIFQHAMEHHPSPETETLIVALYCEVQKRTQMRLVEAEIHKIIKDCLSESQPIFALTARGSELAARTAQQLKALDIELGFCKAPATVFHFPVKDQKAYYDHGVVFCDGLPKGEVLVAFLTYCKYLPEHVLMVDDKSKHLNNVGDNIKQISAFDGLRYGFLDEKVKQFDMDKAKIQLSELLLQLPDKEQEVVLGLNLIPKPVKLINQKPFVLFKPPTTQPPSNNEPKTAKSHWR